MEGGRAVFKWGASLEEGEARRRALSTVDEMARVGEWHACTATQVNLFNSRRKRREWRAHCMFVYIHLVFGFVYPNLWTKEMRRMLCQTDNYTCICICVARKIILFGMFYRQFSYIHFIYDYATVHAI
jgi:hypothetical protein